MQHIEPVVDLALAKSHGLTEEEFLKIQTILGRMPTYTELGIFSVMWSEHCSYKNSIALLKTLPRSGGKLLVDAGEENAGLVDIGDGLAVAFKIESHNHPSAVEPYQGAATGVGGIMRDIFTMGARPIASLNSLRFGDIHDDHVQHLFSGVVKGIGDYGNSFGVPTVAGEVSFDPSYQGNPLVNAMSVGIVKHGEVAKAIAAGKGNPVMIVGSSTGRDGIHGATFASEEISEESEAKRPSVQVGDPFTEKLLLEATLEVIRSNYLVGIQDMGAAGISCSTSEMSAKGNAGMDIDLDLVPIREDGMSAYEIMLSESQERMLLCVKKGHEGDVKAIFEKWDLHGVVVGYVTDDGILRIRKDGGIKAEIPAECLVLGGGAPVYNRETKEPSYISEVQKFTPESIHEPTDYNEVLLRLLGSPNIASKRWVYHQYDTMVRTNTVILPGDADAAVMRIKENGKFLSMKTDCNGKFVYLDPRKGAQIAVAECARNITCTGGTPLGVTNCLNFGNPYKPEMYWQFKEAVTGMGEACRIFGTPVTGGNVSFYNENPVAAVFPTPVIGMVGIIDKEDYITTSNFKDNNDIILILGAENKGEIGGSEYLSYIHSLVTGRIPDIDLQLEVRLQDSLRELIMSGLIKSAHDISDGGLAVGLSECCISDSNTCRGANIRLSKNGLRRDRLLFGEDQSRIIITTERKNVENIINRMHHKDIYCKEIGIVGGSIFEIEGIIKLSVDDMKEKYYTAIESIMEK
jgi:phosphoribosylformylglycinamidine synthase subunit PurL